MSKMPALLLPATASPYAARGEPNVVLKTKVDPWLTATLKRINRIKRPLNSVPQHKKCLTETLAQPSAMWNLCTLMVPNAPNTQLERNDNALTEAFMRFELLQVQAYVVAVDFVLTNEISFKLSVKTITDLIKYHKEIYLEDQKASTWSWPEKGTQVKKLQEEFKQAVNKFVYRTDGFALEGLEDDGAGELLDGRSEEVKNNILGLFAPLMPPPPPKAPEVHLPTQLLPSNAPPGNWWTSPPQQYNTSVSPPPPVDPWRVLPSSPIEEIPVTSSGSFSQIWTTMGMQDLAMTATAATTAAAGYGMTSTAPIPHLPLPSLVAQQCSLGSGFGGFGWDRYQDYATTI